MSQSLWELVCARAARIEVAEHLRERLVRGDRIRIKLGLDPTAPDIHVGHLVVLDVMRAFQEEGHTAVIIIGDYTAMIGDPSGRSETRPMLTREQVDANARTYFDQIYKVLDPDRTEVHGNAEWLAEMTAADVLRLMASATLQQVLQREDFATRLREGAPIGAHEVLYPFSQAYDSVATHADLEVGGTDQLFNLLFGREVQRAYGQEPQDIAVFPLLEGLDGVQKMSKSLGNYIGVDEAPAQIYGKSMSIPDALTERYVTLVSGLGAEDVRTTLALGPRDAKAALARRLVERLHGAEAAAAAEEDFDRKFRQRQVPTDVEEIAVKGARDIVSVLVEAGLERSRGAARRLVEQGGVRVEGEKVGPDFEVSDGQVLRVGRHRFVRVKLG
ncbi:MAG TPA: tyrosine--tRNA ligase [Candidatus Dormibacteraeota bacterium]